MEKVEKVLEKIAITTNKNSLPGDVSAVNPGGIRLGTPALTSRGFDEQDFEVVAEFLDRGCKLASRVQLIAEEELNLQLDDTNVQKKGKVLLKDFMRVLETNGDVCATVQSLKREVELFASEFHMP